MKVLVLSSLAYSLVNFRGALLRTMRESGHHVVACAPDDDPAVVAALEHMGIRFVRTPMQRAASSPLKDLRLLRCYYRLIRKEKPDLVLAYTQKPIIYGGIAARLAGNRPFYALMSGLGHAFSAGSKGSAVLRRIVSVLFRGALRQARAVFVFNSADRADMIGYGMVDRDQRVLQVPGSGVDLDHYRACPPAPGKTRFLFIGRLMMNKGVMEFLRASRLVRAAGHDCEFAVLGRAESENPEGLDEHRCAELANEFDVTFLPETSDVRPYLADCSVFVLPSYYREGLPRTILEAMASARPVITTDLPGCRDPIIEGANGFLVRPQDATELANAMCRFARQPGLAREMGRTARRLAEERYDVHLVNRILLNEMGLNGGVDRQLSREAEDLTRVVRNPPLKLQTPQLAPQEG